MFRGGDRGLYRNIYGEGLITSHLVLGETDLAIRLPEGFWTPALEKALFAHIMDLRGSLQAYIAKDPEFAATHGPYKALPEAPPLAREMARAAAKAGVGPMAAVAGAFAKAAGEFLLDISGEVIVENGGDIFLATSKERIIGVYAGPSSPFSGRLGIKIPADIQPAGICTSSGTVGASFSYGRADAAVILSADTLLADAAATALGNQVQDENDLQAAVMYAAKIPAVSGALAICGEAMAAWGAIELTQV